MDPSLPCYLLDDPAGRKFIAGFDSNDALRRQVDARVDGVDAELGTSRDATTGLTGVAYLAIDLRLAGGAHVDRLALFAIEAFGTDVVTGGRTVDSVG